MGKANPDVYADDMKPESNQLAVIFRVAMPGQFKYDYWANVYVEENDYCELHGWRWGEYRQPRPAIYNSDNFHLLEVEKRVWEWLKEWEYVELRNIGPDDAEYFATDKLVSKERA